MREFTDLIIYDRYEQPKGIASNRTENSCHYRNDSHPEQLGGVIRYKVEIQNGHEYSKFIEKDGFIGLPDYDGEYMLFKIIMEPERGRDWIYLETESGFIDELLTPLNPLFLQSQTAKQAASAVLQGTRVDVGVVEWFGIKDLLIDDYPTPLKALYRIAEEFGGEIKFRVKLLGNRIVGRYVDLLVKRGQNNNVRLDPGVDIKEIIKKGGDEQTTVTAVIPLGPSDTNGARMTISGVSASDKPLENNWIGDEEARKKWGIFYNGKMNHRKVTVEFNDAQTPQELLILGREYLNEHKEPETSYAMQVALLERLTGYEHKAVRIGDTVTIADSSFEPPVAVEARVIELTRSYSDPRKDSLVLGNFKPLKPRFKLEDLYSQVGKNKGKWEEPFVPPWIGDTPPLDTTRVWLYDGNGVPYERRVYDNLLQQWVADPGTEKEQHLKDFMQEYDLAITDIASAEADIATIYDDLDFKLTIDDDYNGVSIGFDTGFISNRADGMSQVVINAEDGIVTRRFDPGTSSFVNTMWEDPLTGRVIFGGDLSAASGTFAGELIASEGTFAGSLTSVDGTFTGQLLAATGVFVGTLQAAHIQASSFDSLIGDKISFAVDEITGEFGARIDTTGDLARFQRDDASYISIGGDGRFGFWNNGSKFMNFYAVEAAQHAFLQMGNVGLKGLASTDSFMQIRNSTDTAYRSIKADQFVVESSVESKKNIELYSGDALDKILNTPIRQYHKLDDDDREVKRLGVLLHEAPYEIVDPSGGIVDYASGFFSWKGIQDLHTLNDSDHDYMLNKLAELETRMEVVESATTTSTST